MSNQYSIVQIGDLIQTKNDKSKQLQSGEYLKNGVLPIVDQGAKLICGYTNDLSKSYDKGLPVVVFGDHTLHTKYVDFNFAIGADGTQVLAPKKENCDVKYLYYLITRATNLIGSEGYKRHFSILKEFNIEYIDALPEQQKIATILTSVDTVIEKTRAQIDKLKHLKTGMMQQLLTQGIDHTEFKDSPVGRIPKSWDVVELGSISKLERGRFSHRPRNDPKFYNGDIPFLQTGDIPKEAPNITSFSQTLNEKGLKVSKLFPKGTLVITIAATIGEIGILEFDSCFPDSLVGIKVNQTKAKPMFVLYLMRHLKDELESLAPQTAQKNINLDILQPFQIPLPSLEEQELIANSMYSVDININTLLKKLENTKNTKKALMQDLLTGKVRVVLS